MKKIFQFALMTPLAVGLSLGVTSCKDDDDNNNGNEQQQTEEQAAKASDDALVFWNVVSQLANTEGAVGGSPADTYEPTIGEPAEGQPQTRIVVTNSLEAAVASFNNLTGAAITDDTQDFTWKNDAVGTLTWHKTGDTSLATVDVSISQIPHLSQIMYMTPEQMGTNDTYYCCYYRFGDVIQRKRPADGNLEYWVCVRPAMDCEGKGDSHWITVSPLPESNIEAYDKASNGIKYAMPTKLGLNKEHMQNLAEMLYAMNFPQEWADNITNYSTESFFGSPGGLPIFHDFHSSKIKYNNSNFFKNVQEQWETKGIYQKVFGTRANANYFKTALQNDGLHLLAEGYSWIWTFSNYLTLYEYNYTNGEKTASNMHKMTYKKHNKDVIKTNIEINVRKQTFEQPYLENRDYFGDGAYRFIIRHATGEELGLDANGKSTSLYDKRQALSGTGTTENSYIKEVYRYYRDVLPKVSMMEEAEVTTTGHQEEDVTLQNADADGSGYYMIGDVVKDQYGNRWFCFLGSPYSSEIFSTSTDRYARFISFDFKENNNLDGNTISGLPSENDLPELAYMLTTFIHYMLEANGEQRLTLGANPQLGKCLQNVYDYTGVNWASILTDVDSTFTFKKDGTTYNSNSSSQLFNIAYNDGTQGKQAIARLMLDNTLAGSHRDKCSDAQGKRYNLQYSRCYKRYQTYDASQIVGPTADQANLGFTKWTMPWAMTQEKLFLQDIASQDMVNRHAKDDKWVTLPLHIDQDNFGKGLRREPRSQTVNVKPSDCIDTKNNRLGMYNEPVLFLRVMKVKDMGGESMKPNLVSEDGRQLTVVHMLDDAKLYNSSFQSFWAPAYCNNCSWQFYLDNQLHKIAPIAGWPL